METVIGKEDVRQAIEKLATFWESLPEAQQRVVAALLMEAGGGEGVQGFGLSAGLSSNAVLGSLISQGELAETESLRLQMAMDRRSKFISSLSNIMKQVSTTQESILQNLK